MPPHFYVENKPYSRTDQLRQQLAELDAEVGKLGRGTGRDALELLSMFDEVDLRMAKLLEEGYELQRETTMFETIAASFKRKAQIFIREIGGRKVLMEARSDRAPASDQWWWFADAIVAEERKHSLLRVLRIGAAIAGIVLVLGVAYQLFLKPDPTLQAQLKYEDEAFSRIFAGDFEAALGYVESALEIAPQDPDLITLQGVVYEGLGDEEAAAISFVRAEELFQSREVFLQTRTDVYLNSGWVEKASADVEELLVIQPEDPLNNFLLARVLETEGKLRDAIKVYDRASELAEESGMEELAAIARLQMGQLITQLNGIIEGE